ncbi:MAG: septum formation initiator family protein [Acidimicrobiia bacterium]
MRLRRVAVLAFTMALLVVGAAFLTNVVPYRQIVEQRHKVEAATAKLESLQAENALLGAQRDALQTPVEIERLAREKLGYVRPGEVAYVVLDPPEVGVAASNYPGSDSSATPDTVPDLKDESLLQTVWSFITGSDLSR